MNSHNPAFKLEDLTTVSLFPAPRKHSLTCRHWLFRWNVNHVRTVLVEPILRNGVFENKYTDPKRGIVFFDHRSAEHYLRRSIPQGEYFGKLCIKKIRPAAAYCLCKNCGHIGYKTHEVLFHGPADIVNAPEITTESNFPCPACKRTIKDVEVTTSPGSSSKTTSQDCDWNT